MAGLLWNGKSVMYPLSFALNPNADQESKEFMPQNT